MATAAAIARKYDHPVTDLSSLTETTTVEALPDGTQEMTISTEPVRVKRGDGWVDISTELVETADGVLAPEASPVPVEFSAGGAGPLARVQTTSGKWMTVVSPLGPLPDAVVDGSSVTYPEVLPGVDLRLTATISGMSEVLVVKTAKAAENPRPAAVRFPIAGAKVANGTAQGSVTATAPDGTQLVTASPMWWDSADGGDASGPGGAGLARPVPTDTTASSVTIDASVPAAAERVTYPAYQINGYSYADNNPVTSSDPTGLRPTETSDGHYNRYRNFCNPVRPPIKKATLVTPHGGWRDFTAGAFSVVLDMGRMANPSAALVERIRVSAGGPSNTDMLNRWMGANSHSTMYNRGHVSAEVASFAIPFGGVARGAIKAVASLVGRRVAVGGAAGGSAVEGAALAAARGPGAWGSVSESMSTRAAAYPQQITGHAVTDAYRVNGVKFDGYANGVLQDAKGPGYAAGVKDGVFQPWYNGADDLADQAVRQLAAAGGTPITWAVAEQQTATAINNLFASRGISGIDVVYLPIK